MLQGENKRREEGAITSREKEKKDGELVRFIRVM